MFPPLRFLNLPNAATTLSAVAGFSAIVFASRGAGRVALAFLFGSILLDRMDGALARRLGRTTDFGRELDSLADALSFSVAPAFIGYFAGAGVFGTACGLVYCVAGIWRLAYFNVTGMQGAGEGERFVGVPTTVAASWFLIALVALRHAPSSLLRPGLALLFLILAALMVSSLPFPKRGLLVKSLYLLLPLALAASWW
ncbi:MAG: CDP-alcohol phosphatidyltransferase family protein [Deltaproteobacteria bacterium]|nr:CDP-alcohol phosphatidyltransferase family protein [Deltaproteobacteria bacterium]